MINPFLKYVSHEKKEDIFHSSAYGKAQNGCNMGAASSESFADRRKMERNRRMINGYGYSGVMGQTMQGGPRANTYAKPTKSPGNPGKR